MKTIYFKAEVLETKKHPDGESYRIKIGNKIFRIVDEDLEQAQVLAVEELLEKDWGKERLTISVENQGRGTVFVDSSNTRKPKQTQIQELTELVRGKERTLEDVIKDIKELVALESINPKSKNMDLIYKKLEEAEQLLKNRE